MYKLSVISFNGTEWQLVGKAEFFEDEVDYISLVVDKNNKLTVAFQDYANSMKATVMAFNGTKWEPVGKKGFSPDKAANLSLTVDNNNTLFIAFQDYENTRKTTVMSFNGSEWKTVGKAGFSETSQYQSLSIDKDGNLFVILKSLAHQDQLMVYRFSTVLTVRDSQIGSACDAYEYGGYRIRTGYDDGAKTGSIADDGILQDGELVSTTIICNEEEVIEKETTLVNITDEPTGKNCENGGKKIETGIDENENGALDINEIDNTEYVCNEVKKAVVKVSDESPGEYCSHGGKKIETGVDENENGILDDNEIDSSNTSFVCETPPTGSYNSSCTLTHIR